MKCCANFIFILGIDKKKSNKNRMSDRQISSVYTAFPLFYCYQEKYFSFFLLLLLSFFVFILVNDVSTHVKNVYM